MTRYKHVLILIILVLPLFALAPSLTARPTEVLANHTSVDTSLPAQFVGETLRVAVYAEDNTTLPSYAMGGVYTDHYANVIGLLESAGYAVTALTTQDILDHKLMVADYDVFVLPNQGPRESIVNHIKDYWLGGGGILNFAQSVGFCFYAGIIDPSYEGSDQIVTEWMWLSGFPNITIENRHPVTKAYDAGDRFVQPGNVTFFNPAIATTTSDRYIPLGVNDIASNAWNIFALDNPDRGGKFVHVPGNCSSISSWLEPIIIDAVDWLAPRPKGRILYDLGHMPMYGVDAWDSIFAQFSTTQIDMRGMLVNRSYTFDKLYPSNNLTMQNLAGYDILVVCDPLTNFTASEVAAVTDWVSAGGSILAIADHTLSKNQNMNYLLSNMDIAVNHSATGTNNLVPADLHVTHEGCATMSCLAPGAVGTAGSAFSIWEDALGVPVIGGDQHGNGRVILIADTAILRDGRIAITNNAQALINFVNWLSAATADVLVYHDGAISMGPDYNNYKSAITNALNGLGISFFITDQVDYFNLSLATEEWDLVISDANNIAPAPSHPLLIDHLESGGKLIMRDFMFRFTGYPLWNYIGWEGNETTITAGPPVVNIWNPSHPIFNLPVQYGESTIESSTNIFATDFTHVMLFDNATALAGITPTSQENMSAIVLGANGQAICNMFAISEYGEDLDDSTYPDNLELLTNEIGYLYYNRPTISHPDDITYMETETGNDITWTASADAGPWDYTFSVNGTVVQGGRWTGGSFTFNVDGVGVSITEYKLTVSDKLGYEVSDLVILDVTEFIGTTSNTTTGTGGGGALDPVLLLIIGVAAAGVVIVIIVIMQLKKKK